MPGSQGFERALIYPSLDPDISTWLRGDPGNQLMDDLDPLLTIAEVSVAFAGFASLVTIVVRRDVQSGTDGNIVRFKNMIYMGLASILFALLPFAPLYFEIESESVWR